jgi:desulfoferrodoxin (superoxide reductase-like protein)
VNVLITHANLLEARGEVEVCVEVGVLKLIKRVVHTRKWVNIFTRNLIKATVVNAQTERAISFTHKKNWRAELTVAGTDQTSVHGVFDLSVYLNALCR